MRKAGIREARQDFTSLLDDVRKGREVVITERGRPVARLIPAGPSRCAPLPDLRSFRRGMPKLQATLSQAILDDRGDRL
jgi:prevent-host-death family protein